MRSVSHGECEYGWVAQALSLIRLHAGISLYQRWNIICQHYPKLPCATTPPQPQRQLKPHSSKCGPQTTSEVLIVLDKNNCNHCTDERSISSPFQAHRNSSTTVNIKRWPRGYIFMGKEAEKVLNQKWRSRRRRMRKIDRWHRNRG